MPRARRVAISLGETLLARMDEYCERSGQTRSGYIASVVARDLEAQLLVREQVREMLEGLADSVKDGE